jgi:hypothetical protein
VIAVTLRERNLGPPRQAEGAPIRKIGTPTDHSNVNSHFIKQYCDATLGRWSPLTWALSHAAAGHLVISWEKLIYRCTQCDATGGTTNFLKRALGYTLVGGNPQQKFFLFVGPKRTGKSKVLEISARVLGTDYAVVSQPKLITRSRWNTHHDSETWSIRGKRYVAISETDAGMDLDEALVKNLTGASVIAMRKLHMAKEIQALVIFDSRALKKGLSSEASRSLALIRR